MYESAPNTKKPKPSSHKKDLDFYFFINNSWQSISQKKNKNPTLLIHLIASGFSAAPKLLAAANAGSIHFCSKPAMEPPSSPRPEARCPPAVLPQPRTAFERLGRPRSHPPPAEPSAQGQRAAKGAPLRPGTRGDAHRTRGAHASSHTHPHADTCACGAMKSFLFGGDKKKKKRKKIKATEGTILSFL